MINCDINFEPIITNSNVSCTPCSSCSNEYVCKYKEKKEKLEEQFTLENRQLNIDGILKIKTECSHYKSIYKSFGNGRFGEISFDKDIKKDLYNVKPTCASSETEENNKKVETDIEKNVNNDFIKALSRFMYL